MTAAGPRATPRPPDAKSRGRPPPPPQARQAPGNMKATLIPAAIGLVLGGMISTAIFADDGSGIEL